MKTNTALTTALLALLGCACSGEDEAAHCDPDAVGTICTIAGSGENGYDKDAEKHPLEALQAKFSLPQDTLTSEDGETIYILDWNNHRLRKLEDGKISWMAGRGELGGSLDDPANGDFNHPTNIIFDETGEKIIMAAWHNSKVRVVDLEGNNSIEDSCGDGKRAYFGDDGPALTASLDLPASLALAPNGDLVIMDQANQVLRRVDAAGDIHLMAGRCVIDGPEPNGPGACAEGEDPIPCPDGPNGPSGKWSCGDVSFCSKPCSPGYSGDDIDATALRMSQPFGQSASPAGRIIYDEAGNLYFADTANHLIRMIDTDGVVHRIAGTPPIDGVAQKGYSGDGGDALDAELNFPVDLAFDDEGTLYFTDVHNHCVRAIDTDGTIRTAVGVCGEKGFEGDGDAPDKALLKLPFGIEWHDGRLLVSDTGNNVIRSVRFE